MAYSPQAASHRCETQSKNLENIMKHQSYLIVTDAREQAAHKTRAVISGTASPSIEAARAAIRGHFSEFAELQKQHHGNGNFSSAAPGIEYHIIPAVPTALDGSNTPAITAADWESAEIVEMWEGATLEPIGNTTMRKAIAKLSKVKL